VFDSVRRIILGSYKCRCCWSRQILSVVFALFSRLHQCGRVSSFPGSNIEGYIIPTCCWLGKKSQCGLGGLMKIVDILFLVKFKHLSSAVFRTSGQWLTGHPLVIIASQLCLLQYTYSLLTFRDKLYTSYKKTLYIYEDTKVPHN